MLFLELRTCGKWTITLKQAISKVRSLRLPSTTVSKGKKRKLSPDAADWVSDSLHPSLVSELTLD
jgi:hypothetical protein